nr:MAG TPA: hypothetical protein [Herelleviridae sp.]
MKKYIELNMISGKTYYLFDTEDIKYSRAEIDYLLRGSSAPSIRVNESSDETSNSLYVNPAFIESFKLV